MCYKITQELIRNKGVTVYHPVYISGVFDLEEVLD